MIELLKEYNELITLFFTAAVGISTIVYAVLTAKLVAETKKMRKSQTDPEIFISLVHNEVSISFIDLLVENIGMGPAYNVRFQIIQDFKLSKRMLSEVGFIKNGIKYFSPKQSMRLWVASFINNKELEDKTIEILVHYENSIGEQFTREFKMSFLQFTSYTKLGTPPLIEIAKYLERIQKSIDHLVSGFQRMKIDVFDSKDRNKEEKILEEQLNEFKKQEKKT